MACDLGIAITCLAILALTLQSGAVQISISLPAKTYTALPDIFEINCVAFSYNSSGVITADVARARNYSYVPLVRSASAPCQPQAV